MPEDLSFDQLQGRVKGIEKHIKILIDKIKPEWEQLNLLRDEQDRLTQLMRQLAND